MEPEKQGEKPQNTADKGYGKRPRWQWVVLYVVVGGLLYWLIYYLATNGDSSGSGLY